MKGKGIRNYEKEYDFLREEIMHHKTRQNAYSTFACTAVITILGGASVSRTQWISLLCFLIILPCALKSFESRYSIALLSIYMKDYLEPHVGIQWETNLSRYYELTDREWHENIVYRLSKHDYFLYSFATAAFYWIVLYQRVKTDLAKKGQYHGVISIIQTINQPHNWIALVIQVLFLIVIAIFTYEYYDYKKLKITKNRNWKFVQQEQSAEKRQIQKAVLQIKKRGRKNQTK